MNENQGYFFQFFSCNSRSHASQDELAKIYLPPPLPLVIIIIIIIINFLM
jgi:hypothetical protein